MNGIIYLIEGRKDYETEYKIGFSKNSNSLIGRLKNLQTGYSGEIKILEKFNTKFGRKVETSLHNFYKHCNINGEWFDLNIVDITEFQKNCQKIENNLEVLEKFKNPYLK